MNLSPKLCKQHIFSVERNYGDGNAEVSNAIFFNSYKLKKSVSAPDFLLALETLVDEHISKQNGYISSKVAVAGETWADFTIFETMADAKKFAQSGDSNEFAENFYSCININSCKTHFFTVERNYS